MISPPPFQCLESAPDAIKVFQNFSQIPFKM